MQWLINLLISFALLFGQAAPPPAPACPGTAPHAGDICFSGQWWIVRTSNGPEGPGPNVFTSDNVSLKPDGLHLKINDKSAEVISEAQYGYGTYTWQVSAPAIHPNVDFGLFTYHDDPAYNHREIDFENAKFGNAADKTNAQFVVQPHTKAGNVRRITVPPGNLTVSFRWEPGKVTFLAGNQSWVYSGQGVPPPSAPVHMNLWAYKPDHPAQEVVIKSFRYVP